MLNTAFTSMKPGWGEQKDVVPNQCLETCIYHLHVHGSSSVIFRDKFVSITASKSEARPKNVQTALEFLRTVLCFPSSALLMLSCWGLWILKRMCEHWNSMKNDQKPTRWHLTEWRELITKTVLQKICLNKNERMLQEGTEAQLEACTA